MAIHNAQSGAWRSAATKSPQSAWFGERLFIAEHTVDIHAGRILAMPGFTRRDWVAATVVATPARPSPKRDQTQMHFPRECRLRMQVATSPSERGV
jgi:hypothetical protein